jgi:hypothetical protein
MALVGMILAGMAFVAAGGVAWRRGLAFAPAGPTLPRSPKPQATSSAELPVRAPSSGWDIDSLIARADERDARRGRR